MEAGKPRGGGSRRLWVSCIRLKEINIKDNDDAGDEYDAKEPPIPDFLLEDGCELFSEDTN
jgi:hypothetical protein